MPIASLGFFASGPQERQNRFPDRRFAGDDMALKSTLRPGIQSVEVAAQLLQALIAAGRPVPLKDLARLARMHPGKTHRYLVSLTRTDLVSQDEASGHYGIGPMAIALGLAGLRNVDVVRISAA